MRISSSRNSKNSSFSVIINLDKTYAVIQRRRINHKMIIFFKIVQEKRKEVANWQKQNLKQL